MKTVATGDTHGFLPEIPPCDLFLHVGDFCPVFDHSLSYQYEWLERYFCPWLNSIPAKEKVVGAGNHDFAFEREHARKIFDEHTDNNVHYVQDETIKVLGLKVHVSPWTPTFFDWAFMRDDWDLMPVWNKIPAQLDILVTHGPPHGVLDLTKSGQHVGSESLAERLKSVEFKHHIFGHIHESHGTTYDGKSMNVAHGYGAENPLTIFSID